MRGKWIASLTGLLLAALVGAILLLHGPFSTLATLRKVDDFPLYVMRYYGDYGFESHLKEGLQAEERSQLRHRGVENAWACTCFAALNQEGELILGRNFDWYEHPALLLFTDPPDGYASLSMVDISYLGYDDKEPSWLERWNLLHAPYLPFDGMNERGLAVGMMAISHAEGGDDPSKVTISGLQAIRLMLDHAKDVEEAIALLREFNIDFTGGPPLHYLISDASGHAAVIEFVGGEVKVIHNSEPWHVSTNFLISEVEPEGAESPCWRYNQVYETLEQADGNLPQERAMELLKDVSQPGTTSTIWSVTYNMTTGDVQIAMGRDYGEAHEFTLEMEHKRAE